MSLSALAEGIQADIKCGQAMSLKPTRFLCHREYSLHGDWEHRLVVGSGVTEDVMYGPYLDTMRNMAGPKVCRLLSFIRLRTDIVASPPFARAERSCVRRDYRYDYTFSVVSQS
jgi:hypothetical protein